MHPFEQPTFYKHIYACFDDKIINKLMEKLEIYENFYDTKSSEQVSLTTLAYDHIEDDLYLITRYINMPIPADNGFMYCRLPRAKRNQKYIEELYEILKTIQKNVDITSFNDSLYNLGFN